MTSKNLFFKLMREDLKRRLWNVALTILAFFFTLPVSMIYVLGDQERWPEPVREARILKESLGLLDTSYDGVIVVLIILAVVWGVSGFSYLHSRKKTDFFHSLPIRRELLYGVSYVNGFLVTAVIYGINLAVSCAIGGMYGLDPGLMAETAAYAFLFHMVYFTLIYSVVIVAMVMTGNLVVGLLGSGCLLFYGTIAAWLLNGCMNVWFVTYFQSDRWEWAMTELSPVISYISHAYGQDLGWKLLIPAVAAAVAARIGLWLFRIRPSETAGRAMAFERTKAPIRWLLVIACGTGWAMMFWELRETTAWTAFGLVCGCVICHAVIEIIYQFDFKKLFSHKAQLVISTGMTLILVGFFRYDWSGYDSYRPEADQVESAAVSIGFEWISDWYRKPVLNQNGELDHWESNALSYISDHMKIRDTELIESIAVPGIEAALAEKSGGDEAYEGGRTVTVILRYQLKNGREATRCYWITADTMKEVLPELYANPDYKAGLYPILGEEEEIVDVIYQDFAETRKQLGAAKRLEEAYRQDLSELTGQERIGGRVLANLVFVSAEVESQKSQTSLEYWDGYPVYESFERTLEVLREMGYTPAEDWNSLEFTEIKTINYGIEYDDSWREIRLTDPEQIEEVRNCLVPGLPGSWNNWDQVYNLQTTATLENGRLMDLQIMESRMPEWWKEDLGLQ